MSLIYSESLCLPDGKRVKMATKNMKESEYPPPSAILALTGHVISGVLVETLWRKLLTGEGNAFFSVESHTFISMKICLGTFRSKTAAILSQSPGLGH